MNHHYAPFLLSALLAACSWVDLLPGEGRAMAAAIACQTAASTVATESQRAGALALQQRVEAFPLFATASGSGVASCAMDIPGEGRTQLDYRFRDGNTLRVLIDPRIELMEQSAVFVRPPAQPPLQLLAAAERSAFGESGCGIAWQDPETRPASRRPAGTEQVYRGEVCNCQAVIERDAEGRVTALSLKSAC